ncbi:aKG-HExxH-type peptide beta-hydroxylase [Mycobacterium sp. SMC-4]|uniref:aKG-HExxH-type peptide beta-hydroxylase n=1 Tax=Mycobacterium sp. SMC-4 TaxID=2857059 RepID=UPI0021B31FCC|nr:HEXXH motif-containing putative peptide modification protein [Mycobacterium sp. SMC-4]UXA17725.1 hypothetical protein KXD98_23990 [Mycobacterium sp. SMC-4]
MTTPVGSAQCPPLVTVDTARYFASPELGADPDLPQTLIGLYASALFELAFDCCSSAPADICAQVEIIKSQPLPWSAAWHPDLARVERLLATSMHGESTLNVLGPMLLRLGAEGVLVEADIGLDPRQAAFWGTLRLPEADRATFRRDHDRAEIHLYLRGGLIATVVADRDAASGLWRSDAISSVGTVQMCGHPVPVWLPSDGSGFPLPGKRQALPDATTRVAPALDGATSFLTRHAPNFVPWIASGMRHIVALDGSDGVLMSASVEEFPGLTFLSFPNPAVELAESLIHEASHHHYLALRRLAPLHDGTDTKQYFSPIKKQGRPIDMILYAFHAFANAAIYHRNLVRAEPKYYRLNGRTLDESLERIRVHDRYLAETRALTEAGETLWKTLSEALFQG